MGRLTKEQLDKQSVINFQKKNMYYVQILDVPLRKRDGNISIHIRWKSSYNISRTSIIITEDATF